VCSTHQKESGGVSLKRTRMRKVCFCSPSSPPALAGASFITQQQVRGQFGPFIAASNQDAHAFRVGPPRSASTEHRPGGCRHSGR
jgi:hypothetical protein